jgi:hypothetical protein
MADNNEINLNVPPSDAEVDQWISNLSDADKEELRRQQLLNKAVNRQPDKAPNLGAMTQAEFESYKRSLGINS